VVAVRQIVLAAAVLAAIGLPLEQAVVVVQPKVLLT
jgi:hypothetical protein